MRVPSVEDVFAVGDCAGFLEQTGKPVLPALAQVCSKNTCFILYLIITQVNGISGLNRLQKGKESIL